MLNQTLLDGNRLLVTEVNSDAVFTPKNTAMVMNLSDGEYLVLIVMNISVIFS